MSTGLPITTSGEVCSKHDTAASLVRPHGNIKTRTRNQASRRNRHDDVCSDVPHVRCSDAVNRRQRCIRQEAINDIA
jgi:hypothetical protein